MTYAEAYQAANIVTAREVEATKICNILNLAQELVWREYPWRWTLASLDPFWLSGYESDYGSPLVIIPSDFLELQSANIVRLNNSLAIRRPMTVQKAFPKQSRVGVPDTISYVPDKNVLRVNPRPSLGMCASEYLIEGWYKKTPTVLTPNNYVSTDLPSQDFQRHMWLVALSWAYYETIKDQRAPQYHDRAKQAIIETARAEATSLGEPSVHPSEGIIPYGGRTGFVTGFGPVF